MDEREEKREVTKKENHLTLPWSPLLGPSPLRAGDPGCAERWSAEVVAYPKAARSRVWYHCQGAAASTSLSLSPPSSLPQPPLKGDVRTNLPSSHLAGQTRCFVAGDPPLGIAPYAGTHAWLPRQLCKQLRSRRESHKTLQRPLFWKGGGGKTAARLKGSI